MLQNKYNIEFSKESVEKNITRLTNQLWKLIPMREHEEDWEKQLDTVIVEIAGMGKIFKDHPDFLQVLAKLEGLRHDFEFMFYRKTIFECISLIQRIRYE